MIYNIKNKLAILHNKNNLVVVNSLKKTKTF